MQPRQFVAMLGCLVLIWQCDPVFTAASRNLELTKSPSSNLGPQFPPAGQRCRGRNYDGRGCCSPENPCNEGEGDCDGPLEGGVNDGDSGCKGDLVCGSNNCKKFGAYYHEKDDCCERPPLTPTPSAIPSPIWPMPNVPQTCPSSQKCCGRNGDENRGGRRCCTPENPCDEGEGDCDGALDGGVNDGDRGCKGDLVCGSNNCKKFGAYYHEKDDCCEKPPLTPTPSPNTTMCPSSQKCCGRNGDGNRGGRRCCTPENPCDEGEGDCDGTQDGGVNDGDKGCKGDLVCGSNNCKKFGAYYHEKDDCCEKPNSSDPWSEWGPWSEWSCVAPNTRRRERKCRVAQCKTRNRVGTVITQERYTHCVPEN